VVGEEHPREGEHQRRPDHPVQQQPQQPPVPGDVTHFLIADLGQHRVHHQQQTQRDRQRGLPDLDRVQRRLDARDQPTEQQPTGHRGEDSHRQEPVQHRQPRQDGGPIPVLDVAVIGVP